MSRELEIRGSIIYKKTSLISAGDDEEEAAQAPLEAGPGGVDGIPPTFTEKPMIVPNETGTLVTMRFKVRK